MTTPITDSTTALNRLIDEAIARLMNEFPVAVPPPELLALLREAPAVIAPDDLRRRATLLMSAGLVHDMAHDVDGADWCYAEAARYQPSIIKRGYLADVRKGMLRERRQAAAPKGADLPPNMSPGEPSEMAAARAASAAFWARIAELDRLTPAEPSLPPSGSTQIAQTSTPAPHPPPRRTRTRAAARPR